MRVDQPRRGGPAGAGRHLRVLGEAAVLLLFVRIGLRTVSYSRLRAWLDRCADTPASTHRSISDVTWAVGATGRRLAGTTCLAEALVAHAMLRRRGHRPLLRIGVRQGDLSAVARRAKADRSILEAHAWVECDGRVVMGEVPQIEGYAILA